MDTNLILKNLANGTITQDAALDLMIEHSHPAYLAGSLLETIKQRDDYRKQLYAEQDANQRPTMHAGTLIDLIDHALDTDHVEPNRALTYLQEMGMDSTTADHHVQTILAIKDRDLERVKYLDDPETAPRYCTRCGRKVKAHELSRRALCVECSTAAVKENLTALDTKTGPAYRRWRNALLVWAYTLEDAEIAERHPIDAGTLGDYIEDDTQRPNIWTDDGIGVPFHNEDRQIENDQIDELPS